MSHVLSKLRVSQMVVSNGSIQLRGISVISRNELVSTVMLSDAPEKLSQRAISNYSSIFCSRKLGLVHRFGSSSGCSDMSNETVGLGGRLFGNDDNPDEKILEEVRGANERYDPGSQIEDFVHLGNYYLPS